MTGSFLLRFQEVCEDPGACPTCGTQTQTRQHAEGTDPDSRPPGFSAIPLAPREQGATVAATGTGTFVKKEGDDNDLKPRELRAIPRCS
jgi:hypothetical protein